MSSETNTNTDADRRRVAADTGAQRLARVYAEALLQTAAKRGQTQQVLEELDAIIEGVSRGGPELLEFFRSALITSDQKARVIREAFEGKVSDLVLDFMLVLNEHDRLGLFGPLRTIYRNLYDEGLGRIRVEVRSAVPLDDGQVERIKNDLRTSFGREPLIETRVDADLLGGVVVRVGDWLYDGSVRTRLENLRKQLIERGDHEIQSGRDRFRDRGSD